jgi:RHS repeat-associated protein
MPSQGSPPARKAGRPGPSPTRARPPPSPGSCGGGTTTTYAATPQAPLGERTGSSLLLYLRDLHGDILGLVQAGASTPSSRAYQDPWGELSWSGTAPLLGFRSELTDPATGAVATPARWYLPSLARSMAPDPLEGDPSLPTSLNRLAYAADDPVTLSDPTGLRPLCGEGCTPEEEAGLVRDWAEAQTQAALSGTGAYDPGRGGKGPVGAEGGYAGISPALAEGSPTNGSTRGSPVLVLLSPQCFGDGGPSPLERRVWLLGYPVGCGAAAAPADEEPLALHGAAACAIDGVYATVSCGPDLVTFPDPRRPAPPLRPTFEPPPDPLSRRNPVTGLPYSLSGLGAWRRAVLGAVLAAWAAYVSREPLEGWLGRVKRAASHPREACPYPEGCWQALP